MFSRLEPDWLQHDHPPSVLLCIGILVPLLSHYAFIPIRKNLAYTSKNVVVLTFLCIRLKLRELKFYKSRSSCDFKLGLMWY